MVALAYEEAAPAPRVVRWVVPAYNESASIEALVERISEVCRGLGWEYRVLVVDDGSSDGTGDLVRAMTPVHPVEVVRNEPNQGLGRTIRRGLYEASAVAGPDDILITLDADLTQDPMYAESMLAKIDEGKDVVIASRYRRGAAVHGLSLYRHMLSYGASGFMALLRPIRGVRDYSCGFRAYRASVIADAFSRYGDEFVCESGFGCMVEIAERLREDADFAEVPFVLRYDEKRKESAMNVGKTMAAYVRVLFNVAQRGRRPMPVATVVMAFMSVVLGAFGQVALRNGAKEFAGAGAVDAVVGALTTPWVIAGLALYAVSSLLWLGVLSRLELSVAYPLGASGYVLVVLLAWLSGESIPAMRWAGVALIVFGILLVGWLGVAPKKRVDL